MKISGNMNTIELSHMENLAQDDTIRGFRLLCDFPIVLSHKVAVVLNVWQLRAETRNRLGQLDAHLLRDAGLSRAQVYEETAKPFWIR